MSAKNKCIFNESWLSDSRFSQWLKRSGNSTKARCSYCQKDFDISNMGIAALTSHASGKKHSDICNSRQSNSGAFFFSEKYIWTETVIRAEREIGAERIS